MDKRTIIGFILIGLIIILYPLYTEWMTGGKRAPQIPVEPRTEFDTVRQAPTPVGETREIPPVESGFRTASLALEDTLEKEKTVRVETELYTAVFSSRGGVLTSFSLKKYEHWEGGEIQLLPPDPTWPSLNLSFPDSNVSLETFNFRVDRERLVLGRGSPSGS
ncbi:MAG: hypothetical protein WBC98_12860, partial [Candidatus Zixiibacteriota bacterium]